ncbi:hypothetical protein COOONC_05075 [Cooperia oncophora]
MILNIWCTLQLNQVPAAGLIRSCTTYPRPTALPSPPATLPTATIRRKVGDDFDALGKKVTIMFIDPLDSALVDSSEPAIKDLPGSEGVQPSMPSHTPSFWVWFSFSIFCNALCFGLNAIFSTVSVIERHRAFKNSFYTIVLVFSISVVVSSSCELIYTLVAGLAGVKSEGFSAFSVMVDLSISYFSALLIFFIGLNRFAAFSLPHIYNCIVKRRNLCCILFGLMLFSVATATVMHIIGGLQRTFTKHKMVDYATSPLVVSNYILYTLPLISSVFYLFAYKSLRSQRGVAISGTTKSLLNKAERCNLKQGIWILVVYLISFTIHVLMRLPMSDATSLMVISSLGVISSAAPQFALPLSVFLCSKEARDTTVHMSRQNVECRVFSNTKS